MSEPEKDEAVEIAERHVQHSTPCRLGAACHCGDVLAAEIRAYGERLERTWVEEEAARAEEAEP